MAPIPEKVEPDREPIVETDVVIIGGGIIGVSAALTLAEKGIAVALFEKGEIAAEQSSRNWGWCRQQGRDPREMSLIIESLQRWREMSARIAQDVGYRECGILCLAQNETELEKLTAWTKLAREYGVPFDLKSSDGIREFLPATDRTWLGGLHTASDGRAEPTLAGPAIIEAAKDHGAKVFTNTAVRSIETTAGRVSGVVTEMGLTQCKSVIVAAGAWTSLFMRNLDTRIPQLKVRSSVFRTAPISGGPEACIYSSGFTIRKRLDGGYTVALGGRTRIPYDLTPDSFRYLRDFLRLAWMSRKSLRPRLSDRLMIESSYPARWSSTQTTVFEEERILNPEPIDRLLNQAKENISAAFPLFKQMKIIERWAGMIDVTPDAVPVISEVDALPGCVIATGFSGHGFGIGPAAGELAAQMAVNQRLFLDPQPFKLSRFHDGTDIEPIAGV